MDIVLTESQSMLQSATRGFVQQRFRIDQVRRLADAGESFTAEAWQSCTQQGWMHLFLPAELGGMADDTESVVDAAIIAEELGREVFAGPFTANAVAAFAIATAGSHAQHVTYLPALANGSLTATSCFTGTGPTSGITATGLTATQTGGSWRIDGLAGFVEHAAAADIFVVTAQNGGGFSQFLVSGAHQGVDLEPLRSLDLGRTLAMVRFDNVIVTDEALLGVPGQAADSFERQLQVALVLQCAEIIGLIDRALEFTLDWVRQRHAFGRPIGSFQALKHRLADHIAEFEAAKAAVAYAARAVQYDTDDAAIAASIAKSQCGRHGVEIIRDCVQMHGGIGLTWEHDLHFYLRRAVANQALLGTPALHHERIAGLAGLEGIAQ